MSTFDVIKYPFPDKVSREFVESLPPEIVRSFIARHGTRVILRPDFEFDAHLRKELLIWDETLFEKFKRILKEKFR